MRFMMLVKSDAKAEAGVLPDAKMLADMGKYNDAIQKAGVMLAADGLKESAHGARVRYARGEFSVKEGPFPEPKDLSAGYWLIQVKSKEEAIDWAKRVPFQDGEIELRPLFELQDFAVDPAEKEDGWREKEQQMRDAPPIARKPGTRRFIGLLKADEDTEAGVMPDEKLLT
ncbi:MAG: YciI family protein, partial [Verrucomicrobiota bacterium]